MLASSCQSIYIKQYSGDMANTIRMLVENDIAKTDGEKPRSTTNEEIHEGTTGRKELIKCDVAVFHKGGGSSGVVN